MNMKTQGYENLIKICVNPEGFSNWDAFSTLHIYVHMTRAM